MIGFSPAIYTSPAQAPLAAGLWAAYSLDKLSATYAGSAIRVRRSSDSTEQNIGFVGSALDTASLASFVGSGDGFITKWYDQSGGANDLIQATAAAQPQIVDSGTYTGEVLFDGINDVLVTANNTPVSQKYTFYFAGRARRGLQTTDEVIFSLDGSGTRAQGALSVVSGVMCAQCLVAAASGNYVAAIPAVPASTWAWRCDVTQASLATQGTVWQNGVQHASVSVSGANATLPYGGSVFRIGTESTNFARLAVRSFLVCSEAHTGTEIGVASALVKPALRQEYLTSYLTNLWGLYAIQKLVSAYAGACIRVRRSNDNAEADIGFGANNQLDETALLAHCGVNSGFVMKFYDQAGSARDFAQATAGSQPRIVNAGVVERALNGKVGVRFIQASSHFMATAVSSTARPTMTAFSVTSMPLNTGHQLGFLGVAGIIGEQRGYSVYNYGATGVGQAVSNYSLRYPLLNTAAGGQVAGYRADRAAANGNLQNQEFMGGVLIATQVSLEVGTINGNFNANPWTLGRVDNGSGFVYGDMYLNAFAIYEDKVSDANMERISRVLDGGIAPVQVPLVSLFSAYALTKVVAAYAGACIRVRRSSDNAEQDIGFSGAAIDTAALLAFVGAGSGYIRTWYDQSGNINHLGQATTTKQPIIVAGGVYFGLIQFDGVDDWLNSTVTDFSATAKATIHIAGLVARLRNPTGLQQQTFVGNPIYICVSETEGSGSPPRMEFSNNSLSSGVYYTAGGMQGDTVYTITGDRANAASVQAQLALYVNGVLDGSFSSAFGAVPSGTFGVGSFINIGNDSGSTQPSRSSFTGLIAYSTLQTPAEIAATAALLAPPPAYTPMPLDGFTTSIFAALSLKKLFTAYAGPCIRVRRSSDNAEADIGFFGSFLDTAALLAHCGVGSGFIVTWYDQSGLAHHCTHASAGFQPRIVLAGVIDKFEGKVAAYFNGSNYLICNTLSGAATAMTVHTRMWSAPSRIVLTLGKDDPGFYATYVYQEPSKLRVAVLNNTVNYVINYYTGVIGGQLLQMVFDTTQATASDKTALYGQGVKYTPNSVADVGGTPPVTINSNFWYIGSGTGAPLLGHMQDFIVYNAAQSTTTMRQIADRMGAVSVI